MVRGPPTGLKKDWILAPEQSRRSIATSTRLLPQLPKTVIPDSGVRFCLNVANTDIDQGQVRTVSGTVFSGAPLKRLRWPFLVALENTGF